MQLIQCRLWLTILVIAVRFALISLQLVVIGRPAIIAMMIAAMKIVIQCHRRLRQHRTPALIFVRQENEDQTLPELISNYNKESRVFLNNGSPFLYGN